MLGNIQKNGIENKGNKYINSKMVRGVTKEVKNNKLIHKGKCKRCINSGENENKKS